MILNIKNKVELFITRISSVLLDKLGFKWAKYSWGEKIEERHLWLGLYMNSNPLSETTQLKEIVEPSAVDYRRILLLATDWKEGLFNTGCIVFKNKEKIFLVTTDKGWGRIYGYFITNGSNILWSEEIPKRSKIIKNIFFVLRRGVKMDTKGDKVSITPRISIIS